MKRVGGAGVSVISVYFLLAVNTSTALKCYHCVSIDCPEAPLFCKTVKEYVYSQLPDLYHGYRGDNVPECPSPNDDAGWKALQENSHVECDEEKEDATCVLGRFRVRSEIFESNTNVTSHGTALGCAKKTLLVMTRKAMAKNECDLSSSVSKWRNTLRHYLEIEHCARLPDMCHNDFCIPGYATVIKTFHDEPPPRSFPFWIVIVAVLLIGLAVIALTFLAPFFNG